MMTPRLLLTVASVALAVVPIGFCLHHYRGRLRRRLRLRRETAALYATVHHAYSSAQGRFVTLKAATRQLKATLTQDDARLADTFIVRHWDVVSNTLEQHDMYASVYTAGRLSPKVCLMRQEIYRSALGKLQDLDGPLGAWRNQLRQLRECIADTRASLADARQAITDARIALRAVAYNDYREDVYDFAAQLHSGAQRPLNQALTAYESGDVLTACWLAKGATAIAIQIANTANGLPNRRAEIKQAIAALEEQRHELVQSLPVAFQTLARLETRYSVAVCMYERRMTTAAQEALAKTESLLQEANRQASIVVAEWDGAEESIQNAKTLLDSVAAAVRAVTALEQDLALALAYCTEHIPLILQQLRTMAERFAHDQSRLERVQHALAQAQVISFAPDPIGAAFNVRRLMEIVDTINANPQRQPRR